MYLAPLNYDRYFRKVFSEVRIAKRFLEDFFDITIEEIELLPTKHKITDNSSAVEFDYRCRINGFYVIIDMQQWFKSDIVKRFYMYHSMNTVLQLEKIPDKSIDLEENKTKEIKDYDKLIPVITLIWLADDNLNFEEDFVSFTMTSEVLLDFVRNKNIWKEEHILEILSERERCLKIVDNKSKRLDFLQKNKLIYVFQSNIVKNNKYTKYFPWFDLASKTKDKSNEKEWFDKFLQDDILVEIISRINTDTFVAADWEYVKDYDKFTEQVNRFKQVFIEEGIEQGIKQGIEQTIINTVLNGMKKGYSLSIISDLTGLSENEIIELIKQNQ